MIGEPTTVQDQTEWSRPAPWIKTTTGREAEDPGFAGHEGVGAVDDELDGLKPSGRRAGLARDRR